MRIALQQLASDFLSAIVFLALYLLTGSVTLATSVAIAAGVGQIVFMKMGGRPIETMQWLALMLVIVLGTATLITQDSRFIMVKPSLIHWAIGAVMLRYGWMTRYLPPIARDNPPAEVMVFAGYAWAGLMFMLGALNFIIATTMSVHAWAWFITVGAVGAKVMAFLLQYVTFKSIIRRKLTAEAAAVHLQGSTP
jgi:intracellular septation protein A